MMRGVTVPPDVGEAAGFPNPAKLGLAKSLSTRPNRKVLSVRGAPFAPRYRPLKGLMQLAVQLKPGFGTVAPAAFFTVSAGKDRKLNTSLPLLFTKSGWLKTLKTSILNSSRMDSVTLNAFIRETSKRYNAGPKPALRPTFPFKNWKSTGSPEKLSTGPVAAAAAGASNVVCNFAQLAR